MLRNIRLPVILLIGFALRLYRLGAPSLWYDETVSAFLACQSIPNLIAHTARDIHPPGYYLLLRGWSLLAGHSEFALAFFSLCFGLLLIALSYRLARITAGPSAAAWTALLTAISPFHLWYSQEVRMYTLGTGLGLAVTLLLTQALTHPPSDGLLSTRNKTQWLGYTFLVVAGMYTLYYFAFLLIPLNLAALWFTVKINRKTLRPLLTANLAALVLYLPWLPIAWRQATNPPVPPWRDAVPSLWAMLTESWTALSLGQSAAAGVVWPVLLLTAALFAVGAVRLGQRQIFPAILLVSYTFGPLLLIWLISFVTPLYHVRYIFTYAPAFYLILGAGLAWLGHRHWLWPTLTMTIIAAGSGYSITRYHVDPQYQSDDFRAAVAFIDQQWQPGDVIMVNAGYVYTAFDYYTTRPAVERARLLPYSPPGNADAPRLLQTGTVNGSPNLGWGDPRSDFYAMPQPEAVAALEQMSRDYARLWLLRAYDTVTDPQAALRVWLTGHAIPLEDRLFAGPSNIRVQGFLLPGAPAPGNQPVFFADEMALTGWDLPLQPWTAGQTIPLKLWWQVTGPPTANYKMSLKLWTPAGELAAQGADVWPVGALYRAAEWPVGKTVYQPIGFSLPAELPPGQYWLNVELYHPDTIQPLPRLDNGETVVTLGSVEVQTATSK